MKQPSDELTASQIANDIVAETQALPLRNTGSERAVLRKYAKKVRGAEPELIFEIARELMTTHGFRWQAYELIESHPGAFRRVGPAELEAFGQGINSWWLVDSFARTLSGPAWHKGQVPDALIHTWARSPDLWWRRAALVSTVAWNLRSKGGTGDVPRTLAACRLLVADHEDMVVKAMSWALRELVVHDPEAVRGFLKEHAGILAARVKREVQNKLNSGLKNPRKG